jgi:hypothetical protein
MPNRSGGRARASFLRLAAAALAAAVASPAAGQLVGENVNMVSGTAWPGGDPFLQRQNEPSIAVSSANPDHLVAGANDYRTVDLPDPNASGSTGDAWLGLFKSFDGGLTWRSVLLPGYPQDASPEGLASPLHGYRSAADPTVRAGTDGMLYYSGIAFDRATGLGTVFVARLVDLNDKENGDATLGRDPIRYLGAVEIERGTDGQFQDKPWLAADEPRPGARTCTVPGTPRTFPAGNVYLAYATFTGSKENASKIMVARSLDCGATFERPVKISESNSLNQGTAIAVDPLTGAIWVAWRRYASSSETAAIVVSRSTDGGQTFSRAAVVADIVPFDQPITPTSFRAQTLPTIAISVDAARTRSFVHLAWQERWGAAGDSRIVITTSDGATWSPRAPLDDGPVTDPLGNVFTHGHQVMPQLTFSQGRLLALYYDTRLDHARAYYRPNAPFVPDPVTGAFYVEGFGPLGELPARPDLVFGPFVDDAGLVQVRHTIDVRVASAAPGPAPAFTSTRVSRFPFGTRGDETAGQQAAAFSGPPLEVVDGAGTVRLLQQLQVNPPNLPMFRKGTAPFMGDYIDIAGPAFVRTATGWNHATAPSAAPVHHAIWTSNQDVRPPPDGDWTRYTPPGSVGGASVWDPAVARPACVTGYEGTRNQNVYTARITTGLAVSSPQNVKPLAPGLTRAFVVAVANSTDRTIAIRLSAAAPAGVSASFRNDGVALTALDVAIPPRSAVHRSLFVALAGSTDPLPAIPVRVEEVDGSSGCLGALPPSCPLVAGGLGGGVTFNPPGVFPGLRQPDGSPDDVNAVEVYAPALALANVTSANVTSANVTSANVTSANVTSANVTSANVTSTHVANPDLANVTSANVTSANVTSANVTSANVTSAPIASANVTSANVTSAPIADANYTVTNTGNTTHSYHLKIVGTPPAGPLQLVVSKPYQVPIALSCLLLEQPRNLVVVNVDDVSGAILPSTSGLLDPNVPDPRTTNATFALAPGETAQITLRGALDVVQMASLTGQLTPVVVPHAGGSYAAALLVTSDGTSLPVPRVGVPYAGALEALGGTAPYAWSLAAGALPPGLTLSPAGAIAGTPTAAGAATFTVQVTDTAGGAATRAMTLTVAKGPTTTTLAVMPSAPVSGQAVTFTATVAPASAGAPAPTGTVTFTDGGAVLGTAPVLGGVATFTTSALAPGPHAVTAAYGGDARYLPSSSDPSAVSVSAVARYVFTGFLTPLATAGTLAAPTSSGTQRLGSAVPVKWQLTDAAGNLISRLSTARRLSAVQNPACSGPPPAGAPVVLLYSPTAGATGASTFRFGSSQFIFNWDTSGVARGCHTLVLELDDGSAPRATTVKLQ